MRFVLLCVLCVCVCLFVSCFFLCFFVCFDNTTVFNMEISTSADFLGKPFFFFYLCDQERDASKVVYRWGRVSVMLVLLLRFQ